MKGGAIDFLTKPVDEAALLGCIERALDLDREQSRKALEHANLLARYQSADLGITEYTVQIHRGHIMRKTEADSFATLVKLASRLNLEPTTA
jgi:FixJ family two-component response regulator